MDKDMDDTIVIWTWTHARTFGHWQIWTSSTQWMPMDIVEVDRKPMLGREPQMNMQGSV